MNDVEWTIEIGPPFPPVVSENAQLVIGIGESFQIISAAFIFPIGGGWTEYDITELVTIIPPEEREA